MWWAWDKRAAWQDMTWPPTVCWKLAVFRGRCLSRRPPKWYCLAAVWYGQLDRGSALATVRLSQAPLGESCSALGACNQRPCVGGGFEYLTATVNAFFSTGVLMKVRLSINSRLVHIRLSITEKNSEVASVLKTLQSTSSVRVLCVFSQCWLCCFQCFVTLLSGSVCNVNQLHGSCGGPVQNSSYGNSLHSSRTSLTLCSMSFCIIPIVADNDNLHEILLYRKQNFCDAVSLFYKFVSCVFNADVCIVYLYWSIVRSVTLSRCLVTTDLPLDI